MISRLIFAVAALAVIPPVVLSPDADSAPADAAGEYGKHFGALRKLTIAVAEAMAAEEYGFRPHPDSMNFGVLMSRSDNELPILRRPEGC
jgi:hypothetical protein